MKHFRLRWKLLARIVVTGLLILMFVINVLEFSRTSSASSIRRPKPNFSKKIILSWNGFFDYSSFMVPDLKDLKCPVSNCQVTSNRALLDFSDAVVFHWHDAHLYDLPPRKKLHQRWILMTFEPPMYAPREIIIHMNSDIDWTATYRLDSDIPAPYGLFTARNMNTQEEFPSVPNNDMLSHKLPVAWMNSHCITHGRREELVSELRRFIRVDEFGRCQGDLSLRQTPGNEAFALLGKKYVFYLAFENCVCKDYVTEKVFQPLYHGLIPVVYGGGNYERQLPQGSFINALDFESAEELAAYLNRVTRNWTLYQSYFKWRQHFSVYQKECTNTFFCGICAKLNSQNAVFNSENRRTLLTDWWNEDSDCVHPKSGLLNMSGKILNRKRKRWYNKDK